MEGVWRVYGGCMEGVWMVYGGCTEGVYMEGVYIWSVYSIYEL